MPLELREALGLLEFEQVARAENAAAFSCTVKAVELRVARARKSFRGVLGAFTWKNRRTFRRERVSAGGFSR